MKKFKPCIIDCDKTLGAFENSGEMEKALAWGDK